MNSIFRNIIAAAMLAALSVSPAAAATVDDVIAEALARSPRLMAVVRDNEAQRLDMAAANSLPDPEVEFEHNWAQQRGVDNKWTAGVSQSFDWPGAYAARRRAAKASSKAMSELYVATALETALDVKLLVNDYIYARERRDLMAHVYDNIDSLYRAAVRAFDNGEATILDVSKLRLERANSASSLAEADNAVAAAIAAVDAVAGGSTGILSQVVTYPTETLRAAAEYHDIYSNLDPGMQSRLTGIEAANHTAGAEGMTRLPGFTLGYRHSREEGHDFNGLSVAVSVPVFAGRHRRAAALSRAAALESELEAYNATRMADLDAGIITANRLKERVDATAAVLDGDDYMRLLGLALDGGEINVITYLTETNYYINSRMQYLADRHACQEALARLNRYDLLPLIPAI